MLQWISDYETEVSKPLRIVYMYYDTLITEDGNNVAEVMMNPEYNTHMAQCVSDVIIEA